MIHFIYRWKDLRNPDAILCTRYVGITINPNRRVLEHLACEGKNPAKDLWFQELDDLGLEPIFEIIEIIYDGKIIARQRENFWIQHYIDQG